MKTISLTQISIHLQDKQICRDFSWEIQTGECWGLLGINGCGKTTLLHTLCQLVPITKGAIHLNHQDIRYLSAKQIAQEIGMLFQQAEPALPQTVWDYCLTARFPQQSYFHAHDKKDLLIIETVLTTLQLTALKSRLITSLSGGEKRRLDIASTLIQSPVFYLLDEPCNHLDIHQQLHILQIFRELVDTQMHGVVMSLHDVNLVERFCDHVLLFFPDGCILQGKTTDLLTNDNLTRLYQCDMRAVPFAGRQIWQPWA